MFRFADHSPSLCDRIPRREWLRVGGMTLGGLSLPRLLHARGASATPASSKPGFGKAKSCILVFLLGGPPQHETFDPKPEAPSEVRGDYKPIASSLPGLDVGEWMPQTAMQAHRLSVLRAVVTDDNAHSSSGYYMLTGRPHIPMNRENATPGAPNDWPCVGAMVRSIAPQTEHGLPSAITLPEHIWNDGNVPWPGQDAGRLGRAADPWLMHCDPSSPDFTVPGLQLPGELPAVRFAGRRSLVQYLDQQRRTFDGLAQVARFDGWTQQALSLLQSPDCRRAFELNTEPAAVRDRYGRSRFAQSLLLARRLVEAGVPLIQVNWTRIPNAVNSGWDTHANHFESLKDVLMPIMDQAYSALLQDLSDRGLLDETLVVWAGEFGRTPHINARGGRDHWGKVFSMALAGGGVKPGVVYGRSDRLGAQPMDGKVMPEDLTATIFHCLGIDPDAQIVDAQQRPAALSPGNVIWPILG